MLCSGQAIAQTTGKPVLDAAPVPAATLAPVVDSAPTAIEAVKPKPAWQGPKLSYGLSAGASFSNGFGGATYLEPSVRYQVSNRFRVNASLTYVNVMPYNTSLTSSEGNTVVYRNSGGSHYIMSAGVDYLASNRLILSGNIWRDFSNMPQNSYNLYSPGRMGADFKATYKITENLSVTGGIRYTDGASPFASPYYNPGYSSFGPGGFGY
nr:hypothetical protein [Pontibacter sp. 172403-2]